MKNESETTEKVSNATQNTAQEVNNLVTETKHSSNKVLVIVLVVIGVLLLVGVIGSILVSRLFKNASQTIIESATNSTISTDREGNMTIETEDGTMSSSVEQKLPTDFPESVPIYESQKITNSYKSKNDSGNYWQIITEVDSKVDMVASTLKSKYSDWELVSDTESDGSYILSFRNSEYDVNLIISKSTTDENKTSLTYTVYQTAVTE